MRLSTTIASHKSYITQKYVAMVYASYSGVCLLGLGGILILAFKILYRKILLFIVVLMNACELIVLLGCFGL